MSNIEELHTENINLRHKNLSLQLENSSIKQEILELKAKAAYYEEQFKLMQKRKFAASSEKTDIDQLSIFDDMLNEESESDIKALVSNRRDYIYSQEKIVYSMHPCRGKLIFAKYSMVFA